MKAADSKEKNLGNSITKQIIVSPTLSKFHDPNYNSGILRLTGLNFDSINDVQYILEEKLHSFNGIVKEFHFNDIQYGKESFPTEEANSIADKVVDKIIDFLLNLENKDQLEVINISGNSFNPKTLNKFISNLVISNSKNVLIFPNLKQLDVSGNSFENTSALMVAVAISHSTAFRSLNIARCSLTDDQLDMILKALIKSVSIREIDFSGNQLSNSASLKIIELLNINKFITNIKIDESFQTSDIQILLANIQELKLKTKEALFDDSNRYKLALHAIDNDDSQWLEFMLGMDPKLLKKYFSMTEQFEKDYVLKYELEHKLEFLNKQLELIEKVSESDTKLNDPAVFSNTIQQLEYIEKECQSKILVTYNSEPIIHKSELSHNGQVVPLFKRLKKVIRDARLYLTPNTDVNKEIGKLKKHISFVADQYKEVSKRLEIFEGGAAQALHNKFITTQEKLLKSFERGVKKYFSDPFEIAILQDFRHELIHLPPIKHETRTEASIEDVLIFYAATHNQYNCTTLLLERYADVTVKSLPGVSLLGLTIRKEQSYIEELENGKTIKRKVSLTQRCREQIFEHLKQDIKKLFENELQEFLAQETAKLNAMKDVVTNYLEEMVKAPSRNPIVKFFSSIFTHYEERENNSEDYINFIKEANKHDAFQVYLKNIVELAQNAGRGLRDRSRLHQGMLKIALPLFDKFQKEAPFARDYLDRLIKARTYSPYVEQKLIEQDKMIAKQKETLEMQNNQINELKAIQIKSNKEKVEINNRVNHLEACFASLEMNSLGSSYSPSPLAESYIKEKEMRDADNPRNKGDWSKKELNRNSENLIG
jgi:hypothetical protein